MQNIRRFLSMFEDNYSRTLLCCHQRTVTDLFVLLTGRLLMTGLHEVMSHSYTALLFFSNAAIIPSMRKCFLMCVILAIFITIVLELLSTSRPPKKSTLHGKAHPRESPIYNVGLRRILWSSLLIIILSLYK